jgi:4-hydroxy-tetrahydrodipicolinate synthase
VLTPVTAAGDLDLPLLTTHVQRLFAAGVDGIALFGTTGEGQSFSIAERRRGLDELLAAGIAPARVVVGTGCAALPDTIELTRHATRAGCAGSLVLPPFFFKDIAPAGVYASYARLVDAVAEPALSIYLYHIPQITGVSIDHDVVQRLLAAYPGVVAGIKDSAGNLDHTLSLLRRFPQLAIFVGHEPHLPAALGAGGAGTICGIANFYPRLMRRLYDGPAGTEQREDIARLQAMIVGVGRYPIFSAFKALQASLTGAPGWEYLRVPLVPLEQAARQSWLHEMVALGFDARRDGAGPY